MAIKDGFKIGDKVKLKDIIQWGVCGSPTGVVVSFDSYIRVDWNKCSLGSYYPHLSSEIYKVSVKGEQLLFSFMKEE